MKPDEIRQELNAAYKMIVNGRIQHDRTPYLFAHALATALVEAILALLEGKEQNDGA